MDYEKAAMEAAAAAIGYQERERIESDLAVHVRYLCGQSHFVTYESHSDPRWQGATRRITLDMTRWGPGGRIISDENNSGMKDELLYRRLPYSNMDIRVELYYMPSALRASESS